MGLLRKQNPTGLREEITVWGVGTGPGPPLWKGLEAGSLRSPNMMISGWPDFDFMTTPFQTKIEVLYLRVSISGGADVAVKFDKELVFCIQSVG